MQNEQNSNILRNLKVQVTKIQASFTQFRAQIVQMLQQNPENTGLQNLNNYCVTVDNNIGHLLTTIPDSVNIDDLKKQIETEVNSINWVDNNS
jgi:hypothetical protein